MEILLGILCFLIAMGVLLAIVAVIGHGIWLMFAAMFGSTELRARDHTSRQRGDHACIGCGEIVSLEDPTCRSCGLNPASRAADELKDLEAAERIINGRFEDGTLSAAAKGEIIKSIETRREVLLPRRGRRRAPAREVGPIARLEAWFGADQEQELSVPEKQQALAVLRTVRSGDLCDLTPTALLGVARLQASVGMLSRACQVYRVFFHVYPQDRVSATAAMEAIQTAIKLEDWAGADEFVRIVTGIPGLVARQPELAIVIGQVQTRDLPAATAFEVELDATKAQAVPLTPGPSPSRGEGGSAPWPVSTSNQEQEQPIVLAFAEPAPVEASAPVTPRRTFGEWVAVFMEERNILWGELIGGTLIVGCSIALVISLWKTLEQIEFFPFVILAAVTIALFGAGFYTLHHWKLESTSRGLLLIATLLVPLDFLVLAGLTRTSEAGLWDYVLGVGALAIFGWLLYRSSRILIETPLNLPTPSALLVTLSMLASAGMQLVALGGLARPDWQPTFLYPLSLVPVLGLVIGMGWILLRMRSVETWSVGQLAALLIGLGCATFACSVTVGFPLFDSQNIPQMLMHLSPALTLLGVPILIAGTLIHQKLAPASDGDQETHGLWRTLGTGLALAGVFVMFGGFAVSVVEPVHRWICGAINIGTLLAVAWVLRVPALHVPAQLYLAVLVVVGWSFDFDDKTQRTHAPLRLCGLLVLQAIASEALIRLKRQIDARYYTIGGGVSTVLAGVLIAPFATRDPGITALALAIAAITWLVANLRWRFAGITYAGSLVMAGAIFFAFRHGTDIRIAQQFLWTLLTHATVCLAGSMMLRFTSSDWLHDVFRIPLQFASLAASCAAGAIILGEQFPSALSWSMSCVACCWLAGLWLTIALLEGWPILFGAFQIALGLAWIFGAGDWLRRDWDWREPFSLQIYALGLGVGSLIWEVTRIGARSQPRVLAILSPPNMVPMDRLITVGLILGQYALSLTVVLWSVGRELSPDAEAWRILPAIWHDNAYSISAWLLPVVLALVLIVWLREWELQLPLFGFTLLALTIPLLAAGTWFDAQLAAASAARWGLALCYGVCSLLLWYRHRLGAERAERVPALPLRVLLAGGAAIPILLVTLIVAATKLGGEALPGPLADSIFRTMGGASSLLIPLVLLSATLAGHGFRERLAYYLLAAGLLLSAATVGGFFLALQRRDEAFDQAWVAVDALLLAAAVAWLWSILWTWIASLLETAEERPLLDSPLLTIHALLGAVLFAGAIGWALAWIVFANDEPGHLWTQAAGSMWSWLVWGLMSVGGCYLFWKRVGSLPLDGLGVLSLTAVGVLACSVEVLWPGQSFIALMFISAAFACAWVCTGLVVDSLRESNCTRGASAPPTKRPRWLTFSDELWEGPFFACIAGGLTVFMSFSALFNEERSIWSAESVALAAVAFALLAYQRRTEIWLSLASLLLMLAGTILVVHLDRANPDLWLVTINVNLAVLGAMSLFRLGLHRFFAPAEVSVAEMHQLPVQIALGMLANLLVLYFPLMSLAFTPNEANDWLWRHADWSSWLALLANASAAIWYVSRARPRLVEHAILLAGLLLGIVLAGSADFWLGGTWTAHHTLTSTWTSLGVILLAVSWWSHAQEPRTAWGDFLRTRFPETATQISVSVCAALVVVLTLRAAWFEPATPYWPVGNILAVSVLLGAMAIWSGVAFYLFASGLLLNVVGWLLFKAWSAHHANMLADEQVSYFILAQVLSFASAAILWSLLECLLHQRKIDISHGIAPFTQAAIFGGILLLACDTIYTNGLHLAWDAVHVGAGLAGISLAVLVVAILLELWRPPLHRSTRLQLYVAGLLGIGIFLQSISLSVMDWQWAVTVLLAGYVLLIVALLRLKEWFNPSAADGRWLWHVQLVSMGVVVIYSVWITLNYPTPQYRLGGALATSLVSVAAFLLVNAWPRIFATDKDAPFGLSHRQFPCYLVLTLGLVVALETCWAFLPADMNAVWLQRGAATTTVVIAVMLVYRFVLPLTPGPSPSRGEGGNTTAESTWLEPSRTFGAVLGIVSVMLVMLLLGQELVMYNSHPDFRKTPLRLDLVIGAGLAILGVTALALYSALTKNVDPYGLESDRRSLYVYLAELLAATAFAHLRLNVPEILSGAIGQFWYLVVMIIAFVGLALSEIFKRKELPILATPLKRSAIVLAFVPLLAFRLAPLAHFSEPISKALPGLSPFLRYLETLSATAIGLMPMESVCWLLLGIFFGSLAQLQKSANYAIAGALAINFGVWVLLSHQDATAFLERPQLWLIPLGLIVLVAEYVNRSRLGFWPSLWVRYAGLLCIYLSSTIEMFKELVNSNPIYPIALAGLAVAGMLLGILFRVRAFVLCGFMALLIVIFAQIWNAAVLHERTWVWWVCGIILGVIILVMFALFEKHRNEVAKMLDNVKRWD